MIDYKIFYKEELATDGQHWEYNCDLLISCYNLSDRVKFVFNTINAKEKHWLVVPDYNLEKRELPQDNVFISEQSGQDIYDESEIILEYISQSNLKGIINNNKKICIDVTGFIKPYMMFLIAFLIKSGIHKIDVIFSEPQHYVNKQNTQFSDEIVCKIREVKGFGGVNNTSESNDILIIGSGYDNKLISFIAEYKRNAKKIQIFGYPSLRADMYQENIIRASRSSDDIGRKCGDLPNNYLAAANDPFATAKKIQEIVNAERKVKDITNLYLSPLATKGQALGFVLYFLNECKNGEGSIIYPFCKTHSKETSRGVSRIWKYTLEF